MSKYLTLISIVVAGLLPTAAAAQSMPSTANPFAGGVPTGERSATPLPLTLTDAIARGMEHNLGVLSREQEVAGAVGQRWQALEAVLPNASARVGVDRQVLNLAALGFTGFPGVPEIIGPFNVFDARLSVSQPIVDPSGWQKIRASNDTVTAARHNYRGARDLVSLAVTNLYLQAIAEDSRVAAARAQVETAEALSRLSQDRKDAGLVPAIDVLRASVELDAERQRLIAAETAAARTKLALARAIGLPLGQTLTLSDAMPYQPADTPALEDAVATAYSHREDLLAQQSILEAAQHAERAAHAERLPSLTADADWGKIGQTASTAESTYKVSANLHVPIFTSAERAHAIEATAVRRRREAELEDARARVYYDVQNALLDAGAARQQVEVAERTVSLAEDQLTQARDRFASGVADTIELVQAQEAVANARDQRIASLYAYSAARAELAAALGLAEEDLPRFIQGTR